MGVAPKASYSDRYAIELDYMQHLEDKNHRDINTTISKCDATNEFEVKRSQQLTFRMHTRIPLGLF